MLEMNRLHCVDCMQAMRDIPDGYFELAIVDPLYGGGSMGVTTGCGASAPGFGGWSDRYNISCSRVGGGWAKKLDGDKEIQHWDVAPPPEYFDELFRVSKNQIIWGGNYFLLPPTRCFIAWDKLNIPLSFTMANVEYAWCSFNANAKIIKAISSGTPSNPRFHPTQKPISLYEDILRLFAKPGDKILDTHVGSASCAVACIRKGFDWFACEIHEGYCEKAQERIAQAWADREAEQAQIRMEEITT